MIEHLVAGRAAYFHSRRRNLSHGAIERLFQAVRSHMEAPSHNLFKLNRVPLEGCLCSAVCFSYERPVGFLDEEAGQHERVFGFLLLIEKSDCVAIIKGGLEIPSSFRAEISESGRWPVGRKAARLGGICWGSPLLGYQLAARPLWIAATTALPLSRMASMIVPNARVSSA